MGRTISIPGRGGTCLYPTASGDRGLGDRRAARPASAGQAILDKPSFGSAELGRLLAEENEKELIEKVTLIGLCTDICVISNALLVKAFLPEAEVAVDAACCAGVTPESHRTALAAMKSCQITVEHEALPCNDFNGICGCFAMISRIFCGLLRKRGGGSYA